MLILDGKKGHTFYIGEDVFIYVKDIKQNQYGEMVVAIGFEAPKDIRILRKPIKDAILMESKLRENDDESGGS